MPVTNILFFVIAGVILTGFNSQQGDRTVRLIRFEDSLGNAGYGKDLGGGRAQPLIGDLFGKLAPVGGEINIARLLAPLVPVNIFCIGLNYREHAIEGGQAIPEKPVVFMKPTSTVANPGSPICIPAVCNPTGEVDYEGELAVIIGRAARNVSKENALSCVFGYTAANDVSARRWQREGGGGQWIRGKGFDTFCPLGPAIVTADELPDPQSLRVRTVLNGQEMQNHPTSDMIFSIAELIHFLSQDTTLLPGTVILTGTPPGVGFARKPPVWLKPGDTVSISIEQIGELTNPVAACTS
jgi:2-keto-4-pentenoate hydratase/2-oxohepta-3-ene-1,7-dioic acid hydratase in catechol pathway